ncbi:MAG: NAD(P)H-hydrate dehydratase, partial [Flavobacteriaceae bacterium]
SKDFLINYDRIKDITKDWPKLLKCKEEFPDIHIDDIIVDAVFGIGLNRPADKWIQDLFRHFRASKAFTLSIDVPSGLYLDKVPEDENGVVWANYTLSFMTPKLVFFLPETAKYSLQWEVLDIGIDQEFYQNTEVDAELIGKQEVLKIFIPREKFAHKGTYGHSLIIGGSYGKIGAVVLASRATLSVGAGLVSAFIPKCGYQVLQTALPEAMVITDENEKLISNFQFDIKPTVIGLGIGIGTDKQTVEALKTFLKDNKTPLVVDADAINILSKHKALLNLLPEHTILTPHPKELERLIGKWKDDFDKLKKAKTFANKYNIVLVIKGAHTITVFEDKLYVNSTGNPGMATAGSGDVLTGILTGLISQGYNPLFAGIFGVYLHGRSADIAVQDFGYESLIASHIIEYLGEAYLDLFKKPEETHEEPEGGNNE